MLKVKARAFTIIELMIAITIISILASIAVPSLLRSRMTANEAAAIGLIRQHQEGQHNFRRTDWDKDGIFEYFSYDVDRWPIFPPPPSVGDLWEDHYKKLNWVERMDTLHQWTPDSISNEYQMNHIFMYDRVGPPWSSVQTFRIDPFGQKVVVDRFGVCVFPSSYNLTGINMYFGTDKGPIYIQDSFADSFYSTNNNAPPWFPEDETTRKYFATNGESQWLPLD